MNKLITTFYHLVLCAEQVADPNGEFEKPGVNSHNSFNAGVSKTHNIN